MPHIINITKKILKDEDGAVFVEYALLVALIALAAIAGITLLGTEINTIFSKLASKLKGTTV